MYIPLYNKSNYSLLSSLITIDDLVNYAISHNIPSIALCDINMYGVMEFIKKCQKNRIKPIISQQINLDDFSICLFVKNYDGYRNIIKLSTIQNEKVVSFSDVEKYNTEITKNFTIISGENYVTAQGIVTIKNLLETTKYNGQTKIIPPASEWCNKSNEEILKNYSVYPNGTIKPYKVNSIITNAEGLIIQINIGNP